MTTFKTFIKSSIRLAIVMFFIVCAFQLVFSAVKIGWDSTLVKYVFDGKWKHYLFSFSMLSLFYGFFMSGYYTYIKK